MKRFSFLLLFFIPLILFSQEDTSSKGIKWITGLSWEQIKQKAKSENKYIFVDCYATWCLPCKKMEKEIYSLKTIGDILNSKFIAVKIQMDTTEFDSKEIQQWYADAQAIQRQYKVVAFPSYLIFLPDGKIVHRGDGFKDENAFIELINDATNPNRQYYTLLEKYLNGEKDYNVMPYLLNIAKSLDDKPLAMTIGQDYCNNYLCNLNDEYLFTKSRIELIASFVQSPKEKGFLIFFNYVQKVDSVMQKKGYAQSVVDFVITKQEINPIVRIAREKNSQPNWEQAYKVIKRNYGSTYAKRNILAAKERWYYYKGDWVRYNLCALEKLEKYGSDTTDVMNDIAINNMAFQGIFLHSEDIKQIFVAITWMEGVVRRNSKSSVILDTYANLLYKAGRKKEAIDVEEKALKLDSEYVDAKVNLEKMKDGRPTWR